jgi:hypothetical protein
LASTPAFLAGRAAPRAVVFAVLRACCWRPRACPPFFAAALRLDAEAPLELLRDEDEERLLAERLLVERLLVERLLPERLPPDRLPPDERLPDDRPLDELDRFDPPLLRRSAILVPPSRAAKFLVESSRDRGLSHLAPRGDPTSQRATTGA